MSRHAVKKIVLGVLAPMTIATGIALAPPANAAYLGTMAERDMASWCRVNYPFQGDISVYAINPSDPHSFRCKWTAPGAFVTWPTERGINYNAVCQRKYSDKKAWGKPLIPNNAFTWRCYN